MKLTTRRNRWQASLLTGLTYPFGGFDLGGEVAINAGGGLKCFGHPIAASGLRMIFESYLQLRGKAGPRQLKNPTVGLAQNYGGIPGGGVCGVAIVGCRD